MLALQPDTARLESAQRLFASNATVDPGEGVWESSDQVCGAARSLARRLRLENGGRGCRFLWGTLQQVVASTLQQGVAAWRACRTRLACGLASRTALAS